MSEDKENKPKIIVPGKMKIDDLVNTNFSSATQKLSNLPMEATSAYHVSKAINKLESVYKDYNATRVRTLKKYSELDEHGDIKQKEISPGSSIRVVIFKTPDDEAAFAKEMTELHEQEVDVLKINFLALKLDEKASVKPEILSSLGDFLT